MRISPGTIIAERYRADRKIGAGAMGEVWAGENVSVGYKVAIKAMLEALGDDEEAVTRFRREAFFLGRIRSDFVARVLDFAEDPNAGPILVLDFIEGEPFSDLLKRTTLSVEEAIEIGTDVVTGLCDLHRANIVHRDLKPSNIILEPRADGGRRAIIVDFGVSRLMKSADADDELTNITRADMALGTLEYMAPEQMLDSRNVTGASDIYAVGAMLFRAVAGKHAFGNLADLELARNKLLNETPPLVTGRHDPLAQGYEEIIGKALRRKPADRYKRAVEMLSDLRTLRENARARAKEALRAMPSIVDDATIDTVTQVIPVDIEVSASFQVERPHEMKAPESAQPDALGAASQGSPATVKTPKRGAEAQPEGFLPDPSEQAAPPLLSGSALAPPVRRGLSPVLVFFWMLVAFGGGAAFGATVLAPHPLPLEIAAPAPAREAGVADAAADVGTGILDAGAALVFDASLEGGLEDGLEDGLEGGLEDGAPTDAGASILEDATPNPG